MTMQIVYIQSKYFSDETGILYCVLLFSAGTEQFRF